MLFTAAFLQIVNVRFAPEVDKRNILQLIAETAEGLILSRTCPQSCLPDGIPKGRSKKVFYAKTASLVVNQKSARSAAMVFEEAARLSYELGQLWPHASALTPKVPAPAKFSHPDAQTHRLPNQ